MERGVVYGFTYPLRNDRRMHNSWTFVYVNSKICEIDITCSRCLYNSMHLIMLFVQIQLHVSVVVYVHPHDNLDGWAGGVPPPLHKQLSRQHCYANDGVIHIMRCLHLWGYFRAREMPCIDEAFPDFSY